MLYDYTSVTAESVAAETDGALATAEELIRRSIESADAPSFEATLAPLELAGAAVAEGYGRGGFMGHVHPDATVRDVGREAEERITKWRVGLAFRDDLYAAVRALADTRPARPSRERAARARLLAARLPPCRAGAGTGAPPRARGAAQSPHRAGGRLPAQHQRVRGRHRGDPRAA